MDKADPKNSGTYRAAMAAVIILSVLMVAGILAVVAGFVRQYRLLHAASDAPAGPAAASIVLTPGAHILSASASDGKLVLHVQTPAGSEVDVMDLVSGKLTSRITEGAR